MSPLDLLISGVSFLFAVMITTALAGSTLVMGKKHAGRVRGLKEWRTFFVLSTVFLLESIGLAILFVYAEPFTKLILSTFPQWLPSIVAEAFGLYYVWFCIEFKYSPRTHWKYFALPQTVLIANFAVIWILTQLGWLKV